MPRPEHERDDGNRHVDGEGRSPPEVLDEPPAQHEAEGGTAAGDAGPDADGLGPFVRGEAVDEDAQCRRHHECTTESHHRTSSDDPGGGVGNEGGVGRGGAEQDDARLHEALAAESVAERAGGEQHAGEDQRVGVDHPLLLAVGQPERLAHLRQGDVEGGVADDDDHQAGAQHAEDHPPPLEHVGRDLTGFVVLDAGACRHGAASLSGGSRH